MDTNKKLNNTLIEFIANLKKHGIIKEPNLSTKVIYVDGQSFNRDAMLMNFEDMEIRNRLILVEDGHKTVNLFTTLLKNIETEIETASDPNKKEVRQPIALLLLGSNMLNLSSL